MTTHETANQNLASILAGGYAAATHKPFLTTPDGVSRTYGAVERRADEFAGALRDSGVHVGDRVVVKAAKSTDGVALYLACLRMGAVYVPLNPAFTEAEQEFYLQDAEPAVYVNDPDDRPHGSVATLTMGRDGAGTLHDAAISAAPLEEVTQVGRDHHAAMLYTSGTTGRPKGAMLSHGALATNGRALHEAWGFGARDVLVHPLPIFHAHGLFVALHCIMLAGGEARFLPRFTVDDVLAQLPTSTVMMAVPTIYSRLLADPRFDAQACSRIRLFTSGSAPMTTAMHEAFTERTGHHILERYGMTEAGMITTNPLDGARVPGTVGFALPGYELRVADEHGVCGPDETGVVEVRGPHLFAGYRNLPEKTSAEFRPDGFFITGDIGSMDAEGRLSLQGRAGDMIISGGENIYPKEIEQCLDQVPGVIESAVVGMPDHDFGELVLAYLVVDTHYDPAAIESWVQQHLARFKQPRRYELIEALPRNAMGKVQKNLLRDPPPD